MEDAEVELIVAELKNCLCAGAWLKIGSEEQKLLSENSADEKCQCDSLWE